MALNVLDLIIDNLQVFVANFNFIIALSFYIIKFNIFHQF